MVENIPPQTAKLPPIIGALSLIAIILPNALLWKPCKEKSSLVGNVLKKQTRLAYTGSISETFYTLEDRSTNGSHCESSTTIINNSPGTEKKTTKI